MSKKLTQAQKQSYLTESDKCPKCKSGNIEAQSIEPFGDGLWQAVECQHCGFQWNDIYRLVGIEEADE